MLFGTLELVKLFVLWNTGLVGNPYPFQNTFHKYAGYNQKYFNINSNTIMTINLCNIYGIIGT